MGNDDALSSTIGSDGQSDLAHTLTAVARAASASTEPRADLPTGADRYERREELGRGGMGVVSRAVDKQFSRDVALKEMRAKLDDPAYEHRFASECLITGNLEHPGVPAVYERGRIGGRPFYTMRRVRGRTLKEALDAATSLDQRLQLVPALTRVAQTLAYAHSRGVVHRDIKPSNIVLGDFGETFVLDWGVAKVRGVVDSPTTSDYAGDALGQETAAGAVLGTPAYMSPEQAKGRTDDTDERSDVFALGALLYHVLAGRGPYRATSAAAMLEQAVQCRFEPIHTAAPRAPRSLRVLCDRAMASERADRFQSAGEFAAALEQFTNEAVAHQDAGPVGWVARGVTVLSFLLIVAAIIEFAMLAPRFRDFGFGVFPIVVFSVIGFTLSAMEFGTSGRYRLNPLIIAMAIATLLAGLLSLSTGFDQMLFYIAQPEVFDDVREYRKIVTTGSRMVIGNATLVASLTMGQVFAWAIARRRALRR